MTKRYFAAMIACAAGIVLASANLIPALVDAGDVVTLGKVPELRAALGKEGAKAKPEIVAMLRGMVKSRRESVELYTQGNRPELAAKEQAEITVIEEFLPAQMDAAALEAAVAADARTRPCDDGSELCWNRRRLLGPWLRPWWREKCRSRISKGMGTTRRPCPFRGSLSPAPRGGTTMSSSVLRPIPASPARRW